MEKQTWSIGDFKDHLNEIRPILREKGLITYRSNGQTEWIWKNALVNFLLAENGDIHNIMEHLSSWHNMTFRSMDQLTYPDVPWDAEGIYYEFDLDLSAVDWPDMAANHMKIDLDRDRPRISYTFNFGSAMRDILGDSRWRSYMSFAEPFYTAALEFLKESILPDGFIPYDTETSSGYSHTWYADLPLLPYAIEEGIRRCTANGQTEFTMTDLLRTSYNALIGRTVYYSWYALPDDVQTFINLVLDFNGWRHVKDDNRIIAKPVELDDRHLEIFERYAKDEQNYLYNEGMQFLLLDGYLEELRKVYGPRLSMDQLKLDVFAGSGTAASLLTDLRIRSNIRHTWTYKAGTYDRTRHAALLFMFNSDLAKPTEVTGSVGGNIPTLAYYAHDNKLIYLHIVGPRNAVNALWAFLVSRKRHQINGEFFSMDGGKDHTMLHKTLPSGLLERMFIHKDMQDLDETSPSQFFYFLDDNRIPSGFEPALNRIVKIPVHKSWLYDIFHRGFKRGLIRPLVDNFIGGGMFMIAVKPKEWERMIAEMIRDERLSLNVDNSI